MPGTDLRAGGKDGSWAGRPFTCLGLSLPTQKREGIELEVSKLLICSVQCWGQRLRLTWGTVEPYSLPGSPHINPYSAFQHNVGRAQLS